MNAPARPTFLTVFHLGQEEELREICARVLAGMATPEDLKKLSAAALVLLNDRSGAEEYFRGEENTARHVFLHDNREHLPLEALEWIARVSRGEEPPYSPEHLEALTWLRDAGQIIGALCGTLFPVGSEVPHALLDTVDEIEALQAKVEPELVAAGLR